jgi:hypothetical protein
MRTVIPPTILTPEDMASQEHDFPLLTGAQLALACIISNYSEDEYFAGWMMGIEFIVWKIVRGEETYFGSRTTPPSQMEKDWISTVQNLSDEIGGWICWDEEKMNAEFVPKLVWLEMVREHAR